MIWKFNKEKLEDIVAKSIKIPIKIQVKRTVTVKAHYETKSQQRFINEPIYVPTTQIVNQTPKQNSINAEQQLHRLESAIKTAARKSTLPAGVYSPYVENTYQELYKRNRQDEADPQIIYDVFISHASEDKDSFVSPLVEALQDAGIRVWYDATTMQWGKGLREQIDNGIKRSKYAIVVLSKSFFSKKWPQRELDGILAKETITGATPLPIWYDITHEEIYEFSPTLAGIYSYSTSDKSIGDICQAFKLILEKSVI